VNIIVLNSGSNGNAVYVESRESGASVLLDCGISRRRIEERLRVHGRYLSDVRALFVSHEHADHVRGIPVVSKMHHTEVYVTEPTYRRMQRYMRFKGFHFMENTATVEIDDISVTCWPKNHDAADPVFFELRVGAKRFLYITDLGVSNEHVHALLPQSDAVLLESNYDEDMLTNGPYPEYLKQRIRADHGHLSNLQAMDMLRTHADGRMQQLILGHLSENNNTPRIVEREVTGLFGERPAFRPSHIVASRYDVSDVIVVE
jgi:phosphoribosyl 1,2-cyclic phosphodiesterase